MVKTSSKNRKVPFIVAVSILFLLSNISLVSASQKNTLFHSSRPFANLISTLAPSSFMWGSISLKTHAITHRLPQTIASSIPSHFPFVTPVFGYMPTEMGGYSPTNTKSDLSFTQTP